MYSEHQQKVDKAVTTKYQNKEVSLQQLIQERKEVPQTKLEFEQQLQLQASKIQHLQQQLSSSTIENEQLRQKLSIATTDNQRLHQRLSDATTDNQRLHQRLIDATTDSQLFHQRLIDATTENQQLQQRLDSATTENQQLQQRLDTATTDNQQLQQRLDSATTDNQQLQQRLDSATTDNQQLQQRLDTATTDNQQLQQRLDSATTDNQQLQQRLDSATTDNQQLQQRLDSATTDNQQLQQRLDTTTTNNQRLQQNLHMYTTANQRLQQKLSRTTTDNQRLKQTLLDSATTGRHKRLDSATTDNQQLQQRLDSATTDNQRLGQSLESATADNVQLQQRLDTATTDNQRLHQRLERATADNQQLQQLLDSTTADNQHLRQKLSGAHSECQSLQDIDPWKISRNKVEIQACIDTGGWGSVSKGTIQIAVKQLHHLIFNKRNLDRLQREMRMLAQVRHPNLVQFIGVVLDESAIRLQSPPMIITELLEMNLRNAYEKKMDFNKLSVFQDVAKALNYLHERHDPIIHRDVSAPNVLLEALPNRTWRSKVSDLGSANLAKLAHTLGEGAIIYAAPETIPHQAHSPGMSTPQQTVKVDVYSYGVLLCEVVTSRFPDPDQYQDMLEQVRCEWLFLYDLIRSCTQYDPDKRPTMAEILPRLSHSSYWDIRHYILVLYLYWLHWHSVD